MSVIVAAVFGEGLARKNDRLGCGIQLARFIVGRGVVYAVEGGFGGEAARHTWFAVVAATTIASATVAVVAIAASTAVAVIAAGVFPAGAGCFGGRIGGGDRCSVAAGCSGSAIYVHVDVEGAVPVGDFVDGCCGWCSCDVWGLLALTGAAAATTATATAPATGTVGSGCAFAEVGFVGADNGRVLGGEVDGAVEVRGVLALGVRGRGGVGEGLTVTVAVAVATATATASVATVVAVGAVG